MADGSSDADRDDDRAEDRRSPAQKAVTLAAEAVHDPAEPRRFMRMKPVSGTVRLRLGGRLLAESARALRLLEISEDVKDPLLFVDKDDLLEKLKKSAKTEGDPLKGLAVYYDLADPPPGTEAKAIAWSYLSPAAGAEPLTGKIAFDPARVSVEEIPPKP